MANGEINAKKNEGRENKMMELTKLFIVKFKLILAIEDSTKFFPKLIIKIDTEVSIKNVANLFNVEFLSANFPPYQYPNDIKPRITPIIDVQTIIDDPKNGARILEPTISKTIKIKPEKKTVK